MRYFDLHCDTMTECAVKDIPLRENTLHVSLEQVKDWEHYVQCYAVWLPDDLRGRLPGSAFCRWRSALPGRWGKTPAPWSSCAAPAT